MVSTQIATSIARHPSSTTTTMPTSNTHSSSMEIALQVSQNGATFFSQGRIEDAMTCFRYVLSMLKAGLRDGSQGGQNCSPASLPIPSHTTGEGTASFYADGLILQPVGLSASLLLGDDERSMVVTSAMAVYNLAIAHHAAVSQQQTAEDTHFYMTSALKLYTLVQSLQQQADSYQESKSLFSAAKRKSSFRIETMMRIATLHNAGVLLTALGESQNAHGVFEHIYQVVFSLGVTPDDFDQASHFDLNAVMARVLLEMNILQESHTAPCA